MCGGTLCPGCVFFFSSRRRHTRCLSDWSSDVCSSDLILINGRSIEHFTQESLRRHIGMVMQDVALFNDTVEANLRSEERRVGKECRCRWARDHEKKRRAERRRLNCK